ncbi:MBL fold metallo-hydrolase [Modestobacter sp. I12A-02628]|uniref:MBL fold metallo-hydrolase n=1 Tax=Goekera deserti TaxID=2497753 RepID=A0A7K3WE16_9ACTN|nr:MBL fold metallo-hydrolase [Goekera deserti]MPQ97202.1 MBL fold metallo-hydrolase [Goekera deserti]NDI46480.1 MBL fold metallo-hydrolase [Goekera deserti]NEL54586.1 MBL fold metallo-hydrolase [Goekera deserti]
MTTAPHPLAAVAEVADGVHAYVQDPGGWCVSNAGIVTGDQGAVVIDTLATRSRAEALRAAVDRVSAGPRRVLVNTHHHGDHVFGNDVFEPTAVVVAHENAVDELVETGLALTALWPEVAWGDPRLVLPTITFDDRIALRIGERRLELIHVGPAHTSNDVVVWLPEDRVLFAGDVLMSGCTPFSLMGSVAGTLAAIERLARLDPVTVVCGHGPVAGPEVLEANATYLRWIQDLAAAGRAAGCTPLQTARATPLGEYGELLDPERIVGNLHRAFAELDPDGRSAVDVPHVFEEMITYNGGRRPTCLA